MPVESPDINTYLQMQMTSLRKVADVLGKAEEFRQWHQRAKDLEIIMSQPGIAEYYDSVTGTAPPTAIPAFGWISAVFIELAIQASRKSAERQSKIRTLI